MNTIDNPTLWAKLKRAALVDGDMPKVRFDATPWYVRAMIGVGGWLAALFLIASIAAGLAFVMRSAAAAIATGAVICAGAAVLLGIRREQAFLAQFALAFAIAGQGLMAWGIVERAHGGLASAFLTFAAIELALVLLIVHPVHRVWSAFGCIAAIAGALFDWRVSPLMPGIVAIAFSAIVLNEARLARYAAVLQPASAGIALALVVISGVLAYGVPDLLSSVSESKGAANAGAALGAIALVGSTVALLRRHGIAASGTGWAGIAASAALAAAAWRVPGLAAAMTLAMVAFGAGRPALAGLGIVGIGFTLGCAYYSLQWTLLAKSGALVLTGAILIAAGLALRRRWPTAGEDDA